MFLRAMISGAVEGVLHCSVHMAEELAVVREGLAVQGVARSAGGLCDGLEVHGGWRDRSPPRSSFGHRAASISHLGSPQGSAAPTAGGSR